MNLFSEKGNSLISLAYQRDRERTEKGKGVYKDGVNQRASLKQDEITSVFEQILGENIVIETPELCKKIIRFHNMDSIDHIVLSYFSRNSLFSRVFELITQTSIDSANIEQQISSSLQNIEIGIKFSGNLKKQDVEFIVQSGGKKAEHLAANLNEVSLIKNRILRLEALDVKLNYSRKTKKWTIGLATGKGSTVWSLMPPVHMLVQFTKTDAIQLIEFYQLIAFEIRQFEMQLTLK